ncbi:MAG: hypothetical protein LBU89_13755 [Fibromonadaceae bacterium]|jgi:hypothetical protein|nr:hypothetical protein [Fibromonadaceae bacterium]
MKFLSLKVFLTLLFLVQSVSFSQDIRCGSIGSGKTEPEAQDRAAAFLARTIESSVDYTVKTEEVITETDYELRDTSVANIKARLLNLNAVDFRELEKKDGLYYVRACISVEAAAKPYLDSLGFLTEKIREQTRKINSGSCKVMNETYRDIQGIERILTGLKVSFSQEHKEIYAKARVECSQANKGVFIESNESYFANKISSLFAAGGCVLGSNAESSVLSLKINVEHRERPDNIMEVSYCNSEVKIELQHNRTGESSYRGEFTGKQGNEVEMNRACRNAMDFAAAEAWEKIKGNFNIGDCK